MFGDGERGGEVPLGRSDGQVSRSQVLHFELNRRSRTKRNCADYSSGLKKRQAQVINLAWSDAKDAEAVPVLLPAGYVMRDAKTASLKAAMTWH